MADFREQIEQLQQRYTKNELLDQFAERTSVRATSYNPLTEAVFDEIAPDHTRREYAERHEEFSDDLSPVEKHALALRLLLHEQIGSPRFDNRGQLTKLDYAECITAIDAYYDAVPRARDEHVPTDLPTEAKSLVEAPTRSPPPQTVQEPLTRFGDQPGAVVAEWLDRNPDIARAGSYVYVLDCTPPVGEGEAAKTRYQRRVAQSKLEAGDTYRSLKPVEQAAVALNEDNRLYYVGKADNVEERIHRHSAGSGHHGIRFTHVYRPRTVVEIEGCASTKDAETREAVRAREYNEEEGIFAYSENL